MKTKLYSQIRFVQSTDEDYNRIEAVFSGLRAGYCEGNSQPVIDYLSDWDDEEDELIEHFLFVYCDYSQSNLHWQCVPPDTQFKRLTIKDFQK